MVRRYVYRGSAVSLQQVRRCYCVRVHKCDLWRQNVYPVVAGDCVTLCFTPCISLLLLLLYTGIRGDGILPAGNRLTVSWASIYTYLSDVNSSRELFFGYV